jgi:hypothetical protein
MKVTLELSGFGGAIPLAFDTDHLPPQHAEELTRLVAAAKAETSTKRGAEADTTKGDSIYIEDARGSVGLKLPLSDKSASDKSAAFKALQRWMNDHSHLGTRARQ